MLQHEVSVSNTGQASTVSVLLAAPLVADPVDGQRSAGAGDEVAQIADAARIWGIKPVPTRHGRVSVGPPGQRIQMPESETHHVFAGALIESLTVDGYAPVTHDGLLYALDHDSRIWLPKDVGGLAKLVARTSDGRKNCTRAQDYRAVAEHAIALVDDAEFFKGAPAGVACLRKLPR